MNSLQLKTRWIAGRVESHLEVLEKPGPSKYSRKRQLIRKSSLDFKDVTRHI